MSDWIQIEIGDEETAQKTVIRGVTVELLASPYDIPEAIRGRFDEAKNRFIIEFKYVGSEETKSYVLDHVIYRIGESSRRLYGLEIDVGALKADGVGLSVGVHKKEGQELVATIRNKVTGAINNLIERQALSGVREDNYKLARTAVLAKQNELFAVA